MKVRVIKMALKDILNYTNQVPNSNMPLCATSVIPDSYSSGDHIMDSCLTQVAFRQPIFFHPSMKKTV